MQIFGVTLGVQVVYSRIWDSKFLSLLRKYILSRRAAVRKALNTSHFSLQSDSETRADRNKCLDAEIQAYKKAIIWPIDKNLPNEDQCKAETTYSIDLQRKRVGLVASTDDRLTFQTPAQTPEFQNTWPAACNTRDNTKRWC